MLLLRTLLYAALCASATGCALRPLDAPWDPQAGRALHEQLPPWQHKATIQCGGHLRPEAMKPGMTRRC